MMLKSERLKKINQEYDALFEQILRCEKGSPEHKRMLVKEQALLTTETRIKKILGQYAHDPCKLSGVVDCMRCTGYIEKKYENGKSVYIMSRNKTNTEHCTIKDWVHTIKEDIV